jgi:transcriptional regulator GlxA family with amidase domain
MPLAQLSSRVRPSSTQRYAVERAESYAVAHLALPISVQELSRAAGLSERGLRKAFHNVRGMSPKRYMLTLRLQAVRTALHESTQTHMTVTDAATGVGFFELGRFAGTYKQAFGERPSDTLRRRIGSPVDSRH